MSFWSCKNLGDAMLAGEEQSHIEELFRSVFVEAGRPNDMALLVRHESDGRLHCEVKLYFSPASVAVARRVGATPCAPPSLEGMGLLVGSKEKWDPSDGGLRG